MRKKDDQPSFVGDYVLRETIGVGASGKVKAGEHLKLGIKVAIKILSKDKLKDPLDDLKIRREIHNMRQLFHPNITKLYEVIETPSEIMMVLEYIEGGELFDYIVARGKLPEDEAHFFFQQLISALEYCHSKKISHRDLKPENLLLEKETRHLRIADFGLSNIMRDGDLFQTACGSPNYAAPEVISGNPYTGPEADIWSAGVILYALVSGRLPFDDLHIPKLFEKIKTAKFRMPSHLSDECKHLIKNILLASPVERLTIAEIKESAWYTKFQNPMQPPPAPQDTFPDPAVLGELHRAQIISANDNNTDNYASVSYRIMADYMNISTDVVKPKHKTVQKLADTALLFSGSPPINLREALPFLHAQDHRSNVAQALSSDPISKAEEGPRKLWYLGLMTRVAPTTVMREVLGALTKFKFEWKLLGPYRLRCRKVGFDDLLEEERLKIGIQLFSTKKYKSSKNSYLLDIKLIEGGSFDFFSICTALLAELHHLQSNPSHPPLAPEPNSIADTWVTPH